MTRFVQLKLNKLFLMAVVPGTDGHVAAFCPKPYVSNKIYMIPQQNIHKTNKIFDRFAEIDITKRK